MSVTLRKRKNADESTTLRLDIYQNGRRWVETLKHLKIVKAANIADRESNKQNLQQAHAIKIARANELESNGYNVTSEEERKQL